MSRVCTFIFAICGCVILSGCGARQVKVKTTAYADTSALPYGFKMNSSFRLDGTSYIDGVKQNVDELEIKEIKKKISIMLNNRGYRVTDKGSADYCLRFNYGCKAGTQSYNELTYVPGQTYTTNTTVIGTSGLNNYDQVTTGPGKLVVVPQYYTVYTKFLDFHVYDKKGWEVFTKNEKAPSQHVWYGFSTGTDEYPDLRTYIDYLVLSMFDLFGINGSFDDTMYETDKSVKLFRRQIAENLYR